MTFIGISFNRASSCLIWTVLGLVACTAILYVQGCSDPPPKPWHTERLTEEFTAAMTDEIRTFDDYRQLEDRLFAQLEEKVYAPTETGPEYMLVRYSAGSAADPQHRRPNWNRSQTHWRRVVVARHVGFAIQPAGSGRDPQPARLLGYRPAATRTWHRALRANEHQLAGHGRRGAAGDDAPWV